MRIQGRIPISAERGQGSVEWIGLLLLVAAIFVCGSTLLIGSSLTDRLTCAILVRNCEINALQAAYGRKLAALVRRYTPSLIYESNKKVTLPVDFRSCRQRYCADATSRDGLIAVTRSRVQPTIFTHVIDRRAATYIQYWFYYPDSTWKPSLKSLVGYHRHDWEGYQVRITRSGQVSVRATAHHGYAGDNDIQDQINQLPIDLPLIGKDHAWTKKTGWTYITEGSHAGHIVGQSPNTARTLARDVQLVPIERLTTKERKTSFGEIKPPWRKESYEKPETSDA